MSEAGDPAQARVWFPPGTWTDWFTGERHQGPATKTLSVPLERMPVFVRAGGIVPTQPPVATTTPGPPDELVLTAHAGRGAVTVYDDEGEGLAYTRRRFSRTTITQRRSRGTSTVTIHRARGALAPPARTYDLRLVGVRRPRTVTVNGRRTRAWRYDAGTRTASLRTRRPTARTATIVIR